MSLWQVEQTMFVLDQRIAATRRTTVKVNFMTSSLPRLRSNGAAGKTQSNLQHTLCAKRLKDSVVRKLCAQTFSAFELRRSSMIMD